MTKSYGLTNCVPVVVSQDWNETLFESNGRYYLWDRYGSGLVRILHGLEDQANNHRLGTGSTVHGVHGVCVIWPFDRTPHAFICRSCACGPNSGVARNSTDQNGERI